jgi:hypothetical protein
LFIEKWSWATYIDTVERSARRLPTLSEKVEARLARKKGDVFLRADFQDLGSYDRVGVVLRGLVRSGKLMKIGQGVYTRAAPSILDGTPVPVKGISAVMSEALKRLGVRTGPTKIERAYNAGHTTQVPSGQLIGVNKRVRRKLGYGGSTMRFERV